MVLFASGCVAFAAASVTYILIRSRRRRLRRLAGTKQSRRSPQPSALTNVFTDRARPDLNILSILKEHESLIESEQRVGSFIILKGGDPAAGSPTATLLRLHPNHQPYRRRLPPLLVGSPTSGKTDFRGVTGGVYKARERIHPSMLISNY